MNNNNYRGYPMQRQARQSGNAGDCGCDNRSMPIFPANTPFAMAFVPFQQWSNTYSAEKALCTGTLFPYLDLPFTMGCCKW